MAFLSVIFLGRLIADRKRAEKALCIRTEQLQAVTSAMTAFLDSGEWQKASTILLSSGLSQTKSEYGFAGAVVEEPQGRVPRILAHEGFSWDNDRSGRKSVLRL